MKPYVQSVQAAAVDTVCRFGITSPLGSNGYDIASIGVGSYLDWGAASNPSLPSGVEYIHVLRVHDDLFPQTLVNLPAWVKANPGSVWVVGNEPDTTYGQDAVTPEVYADRFFELATRIRSLDPSAQIGFGSIVQPTPIRIRYLDRAWSRLVYDEQNNFAAASALIDFWAIHSFILNEQVGNWGTGIPPGFENDHADAVTITVADTYSSVIFQRQIIAFRSWMASKGEGSKPLWITEYGSLFPPIDPSGSPNYFGVSDLKTANFMLATFNFMLSATDYTTGLTTDGNRLVQRWFWYSLNDHRYKFGGPLFDPDNGNTLTLVGQGFQDYQPLNLAQPDLFPVSLSIALTSYTADRTRFNYRLYLKIGNALSADTSASSQTWIYDGNPDAGGTLIAGPISSTAIQRCGGTGVVSAFWNTVQPLTQHTLYVWVDPTGVSDADPTNNWTHFSVFTDLPKLVYLPIIQR